MRVPEINWDWAEISVILAWKIAPEGFVMQHEDLVTLPFDRVFVTARRPAHLTLSFVGVKAAKRLMVAERGTERATVSELQGKWQKIAVCMLWHFARLKKLGPKDSVTLTYQDKDAVPANLQWMAAGHPFGVEWRFMPRAEAARLARWYRDNEDPRAFLAH
jgi:hypothetical protein